MDEIAGADHRPDQGSLVIRGRAIFSDEAEAVAIRSGPVSLGNCPGCARR